MGAAASPKRRWPVALLVGLITAIAAAFAVIPIADWVMEMHHVSTMEGGRACAVIVFWMPLAAIAGFIIGFVATMLVRRNGFVGYLIPQGLAFASMIVVIAAAAGIGYASAEHPPLIDNQELALDIEVKVPAKDRTIEQLKEQDFSVALLADRDARYADMRWSDTVNNGDTIVTKAWAPLRSRFAGRKLSVGVANENRQLFTVMRTASPRKIDQEWSEWAPPQTTFSGAKPEPNDQYLVRYRVRFASEYSPTPEPEASPSATESDDSLAASPSPTPDAQGVGIMPNDYLDRALLPSPTPTPP